MVQANVNMIEWTPRKLLRFKLRYDGARRRGLDRFSFDGHDFLVSYARYLIEYLNTQLGLTEQQKALAAAVLHVQGFSVADVAMNLNEDVRTIQRWMVFPGVLENARELVAREKNGKGTAC